MVGGVLANIIGFAGWGISMGYAWSLILMLQFITFLPLFKLYMPTCHTSYMKTLGIAHGYEFRVRDNFMARSYNSTTLEDFSDPFYQGAWDFRFWRFGYIYTSFIDNVSDTWQFWIYAFLFLALFQMVKQLWPKMEEYEP